MFLLLSQPVVADPPTRHGGASLPRVATGERRPDESESGLGRLDHALRPTVDQVVAAAIRRARLEEGEAASWRARLRWSSLLPKISGRLGRVTGATESASLRPESPDQLDLNNYSGARWEVRTTWDLSRLLFDPRELRVSSRSTALQALREKLVERVIQLYYRRVRLVVMSRRETAAGPEEALDRELELRRLTAQLDALTGGLLSREVSFP
jgi:hypothetical protein